MKPRKQRTSIFLLLALLSSLSSPVSASQLPFHPAATSHPFLSKRQQQGCLPNFYSCANQGAAFANICCQNGQVCHLDAANQPACCPANAVCTGIAPSTFITPTSGGTAPVSFVPNTYFSFPYAPTSFADGGACSSAVAQCAANYGSCTSALQGGSGGGGQAGVTVVVQGGSTVVGGGGGGGQVGITVPTASATSICSSLSSAACGGLQTGLCGNAGVTTGGFYIGTGTGNAAAARPTGCNMGMMGVVAAGVGLGIVNGL